MDLHDLLAEKDFEELTAIEQQQVLLWCTQEVYQAQRQAIVASQTLWEAELIDLKPAAPNRALQALKEKRLLLEKEKVVVVPWWQQLARYSIPVWKLAAAALLLFCWRQAVPQNVGLPNSNPIVLTDTVYLERYHTQIEQVLQPADTIIKVVYKTIDTVARVVQPVFAYTGSVYGEEYPEEIIAARTVSSDLWETLDNNKGRSLHQDTFLQEVREQVVSNTMFTNSTW
ncbi:MAG: hypothetical protein ACRBFS_06595 [Aureispira sp.]